MVLDKMASILSTIRKPNGIRKPNTVDHPKTERVQFSSPPLYLTCDDLFVSALDIAVRDRSRMRIVTGNRQRLADAHVTSRGPLASAHLSLRLRLHPGREWSGHRGRKQSSGSGEQVGQIGSAGLRKIGRSLHSRRSCFTKESG